MDFRANAANGYRRQGYAKFINVLQSAKSAIHIGLINPDDLKQTCPNEWVTRGFNACSGKMLAKELNSMV